MLKVHPVLAAKSECVDAFSGAGMTAQSWVGAAQEAAVGASTASLRLCLVRVFAAAPSVCSGHVCC